MEVATSLLSSYSSLPPWTRFRNSTSSSSASSVLMVYDQSTSVVTSAPTASVSQHFPTLVLLQEQRDDYKPSTQIIKEDRESQAISHRRRMEVATSVYEEKKYDDSYQYVKDFERRLLHWPGLWYLFPSLQTLKKACSSFSMQSNTIPADERMDTKLCDAVILAEKALSASKDAVLLAENSKLFEAEVDKSLSPTLHSTIASTFPLEEEKIVRSSRLHERQFKMRGPKKRVTVQEIYSSRKVDVKRKTSEGFDPNDPLRLFLGGSETRQLLTAKEESELIVHIQELVRLEGVKSKLCSQFNREPTLVEWSEAVGQSCLALQSQLRYANRSREKLIYANFRMVVHIAKQYQGRGLSLQDLLQEGSKGLMKSVEKFKPQVGCRFATYAYWWIRQSIRRAIFQHSRTIRLPDNVYSLLGKVMEAKKSCIQEGHRQPSKEQLAERAGMTVEKLEGLLFSARMPVSLQQPVWADQATTFQEITTDNHIETPDVSVTKQLMRRHVRNLLGILSNKERRIIKLRFGIEGGKQKTLSDIGAVFGLSKERVRQLESRALYKLKRSLNSQGLDGYADLLY